MRFAIIICSIVPISSYTRRLETKLPTINIKPGFLTVAALIKWLITETLDPMRSSVAQPARPVCLGSREDLISLSQVS